MIKIDRNDDCTNDQHGRKATSSYCFEMRFPYKIKREISDLIIPVSYTHLTLPTIYSV